MSDNMKQCPNCGWILEDEEDFVLPSLSHPTKKQDELDEIKGFVQRKREPLSQTHTFTSLNLSELDELAEKPEEKKEEPQLQSVSSLKQKRSEDLDDFFNLDETRTEPVKNVQATPVDDEPYVEKPRKTKKKSKKKKNGFVKALLSILLFIVLTLAVFVAGIYAVDRFTGQNFIENMSGLFKTKEVVEEEVKPTPSATPEASVESTDDPTEVPQEEQPQEEVVEHPEGSLGHIVILDGPIYSRTSPSTQGESNGSVQIGEEYEVYEIAEGDSYTWYRINDYSWVPTEGTWIGYSQY